MARKGNRLPRLLAFRPPPFFSIRDFFLSALRLRAHLKKRSENAMQEDNLEKHNDSPVEKKTKIKMAAKKAHPLSILF